MKKKTYLAQAWEIVPCGISHQWGLKPTLTCTVWSVFIVSMKKLCILCYPKCAQWRFWSDRANVQSTVRMRSLIWIFTRHTSDNVFWLYGSFCCYIMLLFLGKLISVLWHFLILLTQHKRLIRKLWINFIICLLSVRKLYWKSLTKLHICYFSTKVMDILLIPPWKHMLWVLIRSDSVRCF